MAAAGHPGEGKTVCVTGASGYIASHVVKQLLARGYTVRGTVRNADDEALYGWIKKLEEGTPGKVELVSADLTVPGSFDKAVEGCEYICHVAAVTKMAAKDPKKEIVDPSVEGTRDLFQSIIKAQTAKRVVLTSSVAAIADPFQERGKTYSEEDWHTELSLQNPYPMAKTLEERLAWKVYEEQKAKGGGWSFELVTIHPALVLGEFLNDTPAKKGSPLMVAGLMDGTLALAPDFNFSIVHVRDVALAHVLAMENPEAKGRYIVSDEGCLSMLDIARVIKTEYPHAKTPSITMPTIFLYAASLVNPDMSYEFVRRMAGTVSYFSSKKAKSELGINFIPSHKAILDTAECLIKRGLVAEPGPPPPRVLPVFPVSFPFSLFQGQKEQEKSGLPDKPLDGSDGNGSKPQPTS